MIERRRRRAQGRRSAPVRDGAGGHPLTVGSRSRHTYGIGAEGKYHAPTVTVGGATATNGIRVLIVDDEVNLRFAMERRLRKAGMVTGTASTARHAIDKLRSEPFDIVLCDLRMPGGNGEELLRWLGSYSPSTKAIVISAYINEEFKETYPEGDNLRHCEKPVDLDELVGTIEALGPRKGFFGNAIELDLFDYVQMIALTGRDKLIEVTTPKGKGLIWFEHGDIVHVEYGEFRGETAFYRVLSANRGSFQENFWTAPPKHTVQRSSTHLLMEAARMADEGTLAQLETETPVASVAAMPPTGDAAGDAADDEVSFESLNADNGAQLEEIEIEDDTAQISVAAPAVPPPVPARPPPRPQPVLQPTTDPGLTPTATDGGNPGLAGHAIFEDPDTRQVMLEQFWQFEGINGVAIISSTGKVLAEDMRTNSSMVTLAGFYMRGAARLARTLGYNVFDGVVARSMNGQQMVMVSMGAASAVLSVEAGNDPEAVRDAVMGVE